MKRQVTEEFREAARAFMNGLWADEHRRSLFSGTLSTIWDDFKSDPRYAALVKRLADAGRKNGRHS